MDKGEQILEIIDTGHLNKNKNKIILINYYYPEWFSIFDYNK